MIWAVLILALLLSFVLSGMESAVLSVSRVRVRHAADEGDSAARRLRPLIEDRDATLGAVTVANHVTNLAAFLIVLWKLQHIPEMWGYVTGFVLALPVFLIGLEVVPKKLFRRYPFRLLRTLAPLLSVIGWLRAPFRAFHRREAGAGGGRQSEPATREDMRHLASALAQRGLLGEPTSRFVRHVLSYQGFRIGDLALPLTRIIAVPPDMPVITARQIAYENGFSALPVLAEDGRFAGVFEAVHLPPNLPEDRLVRQHMRPMEEVREADPALRTLQRLRKHGRTLALVKDGTDHASGIVTEDDLLGPLLGRETTS